MSAHGPRRPTAGRKPRPRRLSMQFVAPPNAETGLRSDVSGLLAVAYIYRMTDRCAWVSQPFELTVLQFENIQYLLELCVKEDVDGLLIGA